jgi:hypothetical protein
MHHALLIIGFFAMTVIGLAALALALTASNRVMTSARQSATEIALRQGSVSLFELTSQTGISTAEAEIVLRTASGMGHLFEGPDGRYYRALQKQPEESPELWWQLTFFPHCTMPKSRSGTGSGGFVCHCLDFCLIDGSCDTKTELAVTLIALKSMPARGPQG